MTRQSTLWSIVTLFALVLAPLSLAQDGHKHDHGGHGHDHGHGHGHEMSAEQKAWMAFMTPGDMHSMMKQSEGKWKTKSSFWMAPGTQAMVSEGTCTNEMILGGRYLQETHSGTMMGQPMQGIALQAYDNVKKKFYSTWIDNMGTGVAMSEGVYDAKTKTVTMTGHMTDPVTGGDIKYRSTMKIINDKKRVMEMYTKADGKEYKMMEIVYTRV